MSLIEMWDSVAPAWDRQAAFVDEHTKPATERMLAVAEIGPGDSVLELACGPGGAGLAAAALVGEGGRVTLSDGAPHMVEVAAHRSAGLPQVHTAVVDLEAIDLPADAFDAVLCRHGLMFVEDPVTTVRSVARVLRPGSMLAVATWDRRADNPWLGLLLDAVGAQFGVPFPPPHVPGPFSLDDADRLGGVFRDAGLEDVQVEAVSTPMRAASLEEWWERVPQLAGPLAAAMAGMEAEVREEIHARALASAAAVVPSTADWVVFPGAILVASGRRAGG